MITALDDYPFDKLTERYEWVAHNNSNWKIFADAFQEYYHVPSLHVQQVPPEVRVPNAEIRLRPFPTRRSAPRWCPPPVPGAGCSPPEYMYPIERATHSGLVGTVAHTGDRTSPPG